MPVFENHFEGRTTVVIGDYCSNGCQYFHKDQAQEVFNKFNVPEKYSQDVLNSFGKELEFDLSNASVAVRREVAKHYIPELLKILSTDSSWVVRAQVATHYIPELLKVLSTDEDSNVRHKAQKTLKDMENA